VSNVLGATIGSLANQQTGIISGGAGGGATISGGAGGAGVSNAGLITMLTNSYLGTIGGGDGGSGAHGGAGGAGVSNASGATIGMLNNEATAEIFGGNGGQPGASGAGVSNRGGIGTLTNSGFIQGSIGVLNTNTGSIGTLNNLVGALIHGFQMGISNPGAIGALNNAGTIDPGSGGYAIYSTGTIGPITNSGRIIGNVEIDNQASVTVTGGAGKKFGRWTSGTITIGNGNLTFASGNTALRDDISVDGGAGTVTNKGALQIAAPEAITGSFTQSAAGVLGLDFAGDVFGEYGALSVSKLTTLDGGLAIDLTGGFTLAKGDSFDILAFRSLMGGFDALSLDTAACSSTVADIWTCGGGVRLREVIDATSLDLFVARGSAVFGPAGSSPIPEPSTWAMLALGFLGLGGLGLSKRKRADEIGLR
jgi:PEP-CTERM motif